MLLILHRFYFELFKNKEKKYLISNNFYFFPYKISAIRDKIR